MSQEISLHELDARGTDQISNETNLAPVDTGFAAWSFLISAAMVEAVVWSIPFSYGILLDAYLQDAKVTSQPRASTLLPLVGTLSSGTIYCTGVIVYPYIARYPAHRRPLMWVGTALCWISLLASSYTHKVSELVFLQGVLYGLGGAVIYPPCISYMSEWFVRRRGLANGVLFAGTAATGLVLPFVIPPLLESVGIAATLRILSGMVLSLLLPALYYIRPRLPESRIHGPGRRTGALLGWAKDPSWWSLVVANTIQGFAFFVPILWIPTFSSALGLDSSMSSLALALLNGSSALGPVVVGLLSDRFTPWPIALLTATLSCISTFILWGVIGNVAGLMLFGATYGLFAGGWSTLWSDFVQRISKGEPSVAMSLYGFLMMTRGLGNVLCTPISTSLANISGRGNSTIGGKGGFTVDQGRFEKLIIYVGACYAAVSLMALIGWLRELSYRARGA